MAASEHGKQEQRTYDLAQDGPLSIVTGVRYEIRVSDSRCVENARWSAEQARTDEEVSLHAAARGFCDGARAVCRIFEKDVASADDFVASLQAEVRGERVEAAWTYRYTSDADEEGDDQAYTKPEYYFVCEVAGRRARSGLLEFKDFVELEAVDIADEPAAGHRFVLHLPDGETREGTLDEAGYARVDDVPPGSCWIEWPDLVPDLEEE